MSARDSGDTTDSGSATDAGHATDAGDAGQSSCTCIDLSAIVYISNAGLCDCPTIPYGCEGSATPFPRVCDIAPPCWSLVVDPATGCDMPAVPNNVPPECSCVSGDRDAGAGRG
ncbi:MAG: hypothetical protein RIT81_41560 [Deltaproteobacteria bacterium]